MGVLILLICPCFLAFVWVFVVNWVSKNFQAGKSPHKSPLEYFNAEIRKNKHAWVQVELNDGTLIGGVFGFMTSYPEELGIFLKQFWALENDVFKRNNDEKDLEIVILSKDIKTMAFSEIS